MEDFFIIPNRNIDSAWNPPNRSLELFVLEYCEEVLTIPLYLIKDARCTREGMEIELRGLEPWMADEDWYINLFRVSTYVRAS
jgi:hypothetical protein